MKTLNKQKGFTLAELLIAILVLSILATIAYPSYQQYVLQTRIENARADMLYNAQQLERFYIQNKSFLGFSNLKNDNPYFDIDLPSASHTAESFTLRAQPKSNGNSGETRMILLNDSNIMSICDSTGATKEQCQIQ